MGSVDFCLTVQSNYRLLNKHHLGTRRKLARFHCPNQRQVHRL